MINGGHFIDLAELASREAHPDMERLKKVYPLAAEGIRLTCKYGVVSYRGTFHCNDEHQLVFETDDAMEAMAALETLAAQVGPDIGYMLILRPQPTW